MRRGFTLMEILISVMIIVVVGFTLLKLNSQNRSFALYIDKRPLISFSSTLYNFTPIEKYHKSQKSAYDLIYSNFDIKNDDFRVYLKDLKRDIEIEDEVVVFKDKDIEFEIVAKEYRLQKGITNSFFRLELKR